MMRCAWMIALTMWVVAAGTGCSAKPQAEDAPRSSVALSDVASTQAGVEAFDPNVDPCAMRLHDLCGPLLLYFARHESLPATADELMGMPGLDVPELACPASGQKYVYNPHGPTGPQAGTRIILYDATPAHGGRRWGIAVSEPQPGQALVARVVVLPQSVFDQR